ncbi:hypothetical protein [Halovenus sp. HT40]|uniref:hypothetical protein n=1 Tax=Halovenus sp. HT40 TaxID=3126691 RepID=UPI00300F470B
MPNSQPDSSVSDSLGGSRWEMLLGVAYVVAGVALFAGLLTDSFGLSAAVLGSLLLLIVLSLGTIIRREGLITPENKVIGGCVLAAMGLLFGCSQYTEFSRELIFGVVFLVGVIVPHLLVQYLGYGGD